MHLNQLVIEEGSQPPSSSSLKTRVEILLDLGFCQKLLDFTLGHLVFPCYHQCDTYYGKRSIDQVPPLNSKENISVISELCFEETASGIQVYFFKNNLFNHKVLEYWMYLQVQCVNGQVNDKKSFVNNAANIGEYHVYQHKFQ